MKLRTKKLQVNKILSLVTKKECNLQSRITKKNANKFNNNVHTRDLNAKLNLLLSFKTISDFGLVVFKETWLSENVNNLELTVLRIQLFKLDRFVRK